MEGRGSAVNTPATSRPVTRRSKSYGRSCVEAPSYFWQTPGHLTVLKIPTSREAAKSQIITNKVDPEHIALLVKNEWKLSYVTPLYRFRHTELKSYSKHLSAFIIAERQKGVAVEVGLEAGFKVTFTSVLGLAETSEDAETVFIQIQSKPVFAAAADAPKVVWRGWLTCVNGDPEYLRALPPDFVSLPLFCTSGPESLTTLVKSWFERAFDCNFGSLALNSTTLNWLAALWTGCHPTCNIRYLKLAWSLPSQPPLDVSYTVNPQDAWELWNSIHPEESTDGRIDIKEVQSFMNGLETHFFRHFKIYLSAGMLVKVSTALGSAQLDGKIKIGNSDYITTLLTMLTECALLKMLT
ncbi:centromere protein L [Megalobrama amblycephala]|uniref:centromere protein L n=1 Tax=Megalobrama amblycephala TaxID=75352 RepID=UPI002013C355|nr:centromere protein L [Megalobrama amblycephala]